MAVLSAPKRQAWRRSTSPAQTRQLHRYRTVASWGFAWHGHGLSDLRAVARIRPKLAEEGFGQRLGRLRAFRVGRVDRGRTACGGARNGCLLYTSPSPRD